MPDIRRDFFTNKLVLIKPGEWAPKQAKKKHADAKDCIFCPGNEAKTPPSDLLLASRHGTMLKLSDTPEDYVQDWVVRVIPNQFPAVSLDSPTKYSDPPLYSEPALGYHYIVVASQKHVNFEDVDADQWVNVLSVLQDKARWLYARKNVAYVAIYLNQGRDAGATRSHAHLQIVTLPVLPPAIEREAKAVQKIVHETGACPMCEIGSKASEGPRKIFQTEGFLTFAPHASSHPFEFWIFPRGHQVSFLRASQKEIMDLAGILELSLNSLAKVVGDLQFNMVVHTSPEKRTSKQIHWHIEVYPRLPDIDGFERGTGLYINNIAPETAAKMMREAAIKILKSRGTT